MSYHDKNLGEDGGVPGKRRSDALLPLTMLQKRASSERTKKIQASFFGFGLYDML